jgi:hypothetical protein
VPHSSLTRVPVRNDRGRAERQPGGQLRAVVRATRAARRGWQRLPRAERRGTGRAQDRIRRGVREAHAKEMPIRETHRAGPPIGLANARSAARASVIIAAGSGTKSMFRHYSVSRFLQLTLMVRRPCRSCGLGMPPGSFSHWTQGTAAGSDKGACDSRGRCSVIGQPTPTQGGLKWRGDDDGLDHAVSTAGFR